MCFIPQKVTIKICQLRKKKAHVGPARWANVWNCHLNARKKKRKQFAMVLNHCSMRNAEIEYMALICCHFVCQQYSAHLPASLALSVPLTLAVSVPQLVERIRSIVLPL